MSETTNFGQASLVVGGITNSGPSMNVTSIRVSNTVLSFDSSTGSITANVYDTNGTLIRLSRVPIQIQSASQPASVGPGDEWVCTSNSNVFKYTSTIGWGWLGTYAAAQLYSFTTATFNTGGATSINGPVISQARSGLTGTPDPSTWYNTYLNMTTQGFQLWTVPATGSYTIVAAGARGGNKVDYTGAGNGAKVTGVFSLTQGQILAIVIGQYGDDNGSTSSGGGGGGGGSFVYDSNTLSPLLIAGGGGGVGGGNAVRSPGRNGDVYQNGTASFLDYAASTGTFTYQIYATAGNGGWSYGAYSTGDYDSGGGAGWNQNGYNGGQFPNTQGGRTRTSGFLGGGYDSSRYPYVAAGGFGGGGAASDGGGGGGGYTGGNGGRWNSVASGGGAGGSYSSLANPATGGLGTNNGAGYVTITKI